MSMMRRSQPTTTGDQISDGSGALMLLVCVVGVIACALFCGCTA